MGPNDYVQPGTVTPLRPARAKRRTGLVLVITLVGLVVFVWAFLGVYTVQPIGAIPDGVTIVVWRNSGEPIFDSPDATYACVPCRKARICRTSAPLVSSDAQPPSSPITTMPTSGHFALCT